MDVQFNGFLRDAALFLNSAIELREKSEEEDLLRRIKQVFGENMSVKSLISNIYLAIMTEHFFDSKLTNDVIQRLVQSIKRISLTEDLKNRIEVLSKLIEVYSTTNKKINEKNNVCFQMNEACIEPAEICQNSKRQKLVDNRDVPSLMKDINQFFENNPQSNEIKIGLYFIPKALIQKIQENNILSSSDQLLSIQIVTDSEHEVFDLNGFEKELLLQQSSFFKSLWLGYYKEAQIDHSSSIIDVKRLKILLESLYHPTVLENHAEDILNLLYTAHHYGLSLCEERLIDLWSRYLKESLQDDSFESVAELLQFSKDFERELGFQQKGQKILNHYLREVIDEPKIFRHKIKGLVTSLTPSNLLDEFLADLDFHSTQCCNESLKALMNLTSLKKLNLSNCHKITNEGLQYLPKKSLEELFLFDFNESNSIEITSEGIKYLQEISLNSLSICTSDEVTFQDIENLKKISTLQQLNLCLQNITTNSLQCLQGLPLKKLSLMNSEITCEMLQSLQGTSLELLDLSECCISDKELKFLQEMKELQEVNLSLESDISQQGFQYLKFIPIKKLDLTNCEISHNKLLELRGLHIKELLINDLGEDSPDIIDDGLKFLKGMPLESLIFQEGDLFTESIFEHLKDYPLQKLEISLYGQITSQGFRHLYGMPLKELTLSGSYEFVDPSLENMPYLEKLNLNNCSKINLEWLQNHRNIPLHSIQCVDTTDQCLEFLNISSLRKLDLSDNEAITDEGLKHLRGIPLKSLNLKGCNRITDKGLKYLEELPLDELVI